jgi:hypothetical protein
MEFPDCRTLSADCGQMTGNSQVMLSILRVRPSAVLRPRASAIRSVFIPRLSLPQSQQIDLLGVLPYHLEYVRTAIFFPRIKSERAVGAPATEPDKSHGANLRKKGYGL